MTTPEIMRDIAVILIAVLHLVFLAIPAAVVLLRLVLNVSGTARPWLQAGDAGGRIVPDRTSGVAERTARGPLLIPALFASARAFLRVLFGGARRRT